MRLPQDRILHIDTELKDGKVNIVAEWQGELVRCGECKYRKKNKFCLEHNRYEKNDGGYCHNGERGTYERK